MKVCILVCLILVAGCQGSFLDSLKSALSSIGDAFTTTFQQVGEQAKTVGQGLLDQLKTSGTQLAGQALQSLLLGATSALSSGGTTSTGKRALELPVELQQFINEKVDKMHEVFGGAVDTLTSLGQNVHQSELVSIISVVDEIVHSHNTVLNSLLQELVQGVENHFAQAVHLLPHHKRNSFTDLLGKVGQSVAAFFQPHIDGLKQVVGALGSGVTSTAQQMQTTVQPHVNEIQTSGQAILQHGQNALQALKDAVTDILHQTLTNMQPHLTNIAQHAGQVAVQSAGTLATTLGKTVLSALGAANTGA